MIIKFFILPRNWKEVVYRRIFSQQQKLVALAFVAFLGIILSGFVASVIAEALDNDVQVEPDSELTYYLKVKYDGVDKEGVQSNDATMAKINSGRIKVTDKIPDGFAAVCQDKGQHIVGIGKHKVGLPLYSDVLQRFHKGSGSLPNFV